MSKVFWDSMLFIYLVEDHQEFAPLVRDLLGRSFLRGDDLYMSHLSVAETLVGIPLGSPKEDIFRTIISEMGFTLVEFAASAVEPFRYLRRDFGLKAPDSMNLACAAALGVDLFITGDKQLLKKRLHVPGIHFIASFEHTPL